MWKSRKIIYKILIENNLWFCLYFIHILIYKKTSTVAYKMLVFQYRNRRYLDFCDLMDLVNQHGYAKIKNEEVHRGKQIFQDVGICTQFDCILENLTPKEHLYLFVRMKGLSGDDLTESVIGLYYIRFQSIQLEEYINRQSG
ncbi:unnamed protein product [Paramecium pentaurelia]|uniref:Uncharacterized protein n=1 Tax=Paramecium pentaurelia TaxID=43138 RepID=A0A8S1T4W5_9CILI|nr:unnamed protein product [Paramecium pentaurelia]